MMDPVTIGLLASAAIGAGASVYSASQNKVPNPKTPGAPPAPVTGETDVGKKRKAYKAPAQLFKDEDLRLGAAGKLGL